MDPGKGDLVYSDYFRDYFILIFRFANSFTLF